MVDTQIDKKLVILDYNGTITTGEFRALGTIFESFFGEKMYKNIKELKGQEKTALHRYIAKDDLTKSQAKDLLDNFTKKIPYQKLLERAKTELILKSKLDEIKLNFERLPETRVADFVVNDILLPITACYSVFINEYAPVPEFKELCEKFSKDIIIINTNALEGLVRAEIELLSQIDNYKYLKPFVEQNLIFGSTADHSKEDLNRMEFILNEVSKKFPDININETISVGDGFRDLNNYIELTENKNISQSQLFFIQKMQDNEEQPLNSENLVQNLNARVLELKANESKLKEYQKQIELLKKIPQERKKNVIPITHIKDYIGRF